LEVLVCRRIRRKTGTPNTMETKKKKEKQLGEREELWVLCCDLSGDDRQRESREVYIRGNSG
jgi:hypothetical protein